MTDLMNIIHVSFRMTV